MTPLLWLIAGCLPLILVLCVSYHLTEARPLKLETRHLKSSKREILSQIDQLLVMVPTPQACCSAVLRLVEDPGNLSNPIVLESKILTSPLRYVRPVMQYQEGGKPLGLYVPATVKGIWKAWGEYRGAARSLQNCQATLLSLLYTQFLSDGKTPNQEALQVALDQYITRCSQVRRNLMTYRAEIENF